MGVVGVGGGVYLQSYLQSEGAMHDEGLFRDGASWQTEGERAEHEEHKRQLTDKCC